MVRPAKSRKSTRVSAAKKLPKNLKELSFNRFLPNLVTLATLCAGLSAIRFGLVQKWELAVACIVIAAILDGLDGRIARFLGTSSRFGAELDSLADFCNFGVAPAILVYLYALQSLDRFGWLICLFFAICMALRLARFNAFLDDTPPPLFATGKFFMGIPAPAGGLLACFPMILDFHMPFKMPILFHILTLLVVASLLISRIPTFSFKKGAIPRAFVLPTFIVAGITIASFVMLPWLVLTIIGVVYLSLIILSVRQYKRMEKELKSS